MNLLYYYIYLLYYYYLIYYIYSLIQIFIFFKNYNILTFIEEVIAEKSTSDSKEITLNKENFQNVKSSQLQLSFPKGCYFIDFNSI